MSMWIMILIEVIKNIPTIIRIVKEISDLIKTMPKDKRKLEMKNLAFATRAAKKKKDFKPLRDLKCRLLKDCKK